MTTKKISGKTIKGERIENLESLQLLAQLTDNMEIAMEKLEESYQDKDSEKFYNSREAILDFQNKISKLIQK